MTVPTIGETISEEKILVTSRRFNASITDEPVNSALVKPMPIIAPIKVCELEAGKPEEPRSQVPDNRRQQHGKDHRQAVG